MTIEEIKSEVCEQVNDPDKITYGSRVPGLLSEAISEILVSGNYSEQEIFGLIKITGSGNLITNGTFGDSPPWEWNGSVDENNADWTGSEIYPNCDNPPDGWRLSRGNGTISTAGAPDSYYTVQLSNKAGASGLVYQGFNVSRGGIYKLSFWAKAVDGSGFVLIHPFGMTSTEIDPVPTYGDSKHSISITNTGWELYESGLFKARADNEIFNFCATNNNVVDTNKIEFTGITVEQVGVSNKAPLADDCHRVLAVYSHPGTDNKTFTMITEEKMDTIRINDEFEPFDDEVFFAISGNKMIVYPDGEYLVDIKYMATPNYDEFSDDEYDVSEVFNDIFIRKAIALVVQKLRKEIAGE